MSTLHTQEVRYWSPFDLPKASLLTCREANWLIVTISLSCPQKTCWQVHIMELCQSSVIGKSMGHLMKECGFCSYSLYPAFELGSWGEIT